MIESKTLYLLSLSVCVHILAQFIKRQDMMIRFFYVALFLVSFQSFAKEQYVFCANQEGTKWEWLPNNRTIDGHWIYTEVKSDTYFVTFRIKKEQYESLRAECKNYFPDLQYPQPAENRFSDWRLFSFINNGKLHVIKSSFQLLVVQPNCLYTC